MRVLISSSNYSLVKVLAVVLGTSALFGGIEALLILTLRVRSILDSAGMKLTMYVDSI